VKDKTLLIWNCLPAGIRIVPPLPQLAMADWIAGTSSVPAEPADTGYEIVSFQ